MKHVQMNKKAKKALFVPTVNGGLNLRDALSNVADNQLTDCENMWFRDGTLKTRPGFTTILTGEHIGQQEMYQAKKHEVFSENGQLVSVLFSQNGESAQDYLYFYWIGETVEEETGISLGNTYGETVKNAAYFVVQKDDTLYCYFSCGTDYKIYRLNLSAQSHSWSVVNETDYYIPTVLTHCVSHASGITRKRVISEGTMFEGYNLLSSYYRMIYSSSNPDEDGVTTFKTLKSLPIGKTLHVKLTSANGTVYDHSVTWGGTPNTSETNALGDGLRLNLINNGTFCFYDNATTDKHFFNKSDYIEDNMEVIAPFDKDTSVAEKEKRMVFGMTAATWFGGSNAGLNGGSQLFLGGNIYAGNENVVIWSGLNNPLYFDENCYFRVGSNNTRVTQFAKQSDMLVIFKPNETYYTQYVRNTSITAESLINQSVVDYTANAALFPLTLLHDSIGCDCPNTVQLCRNRLVWATSSGKVYSLVRADVYNELTIYEVGEMVCRELSGLGSQILKSAVSCDWADHYFLFADNKAYVMDYNSSGYQYPYSFSKSQDANRMIPWYRWSIGVVPKICMKADSQMAIGFFNNDGISDEFCMRGYAEGIQKDGESDITGMLQTKLFDFLPGTYKNMESVSLSVGSTGGIPVTVTFVTDCGEETEEITIEGEEEQEHTPAYVRSVEINPCIRSILRFGIRISCDSTFSLDSLNLRYTLLGGAR